jgi:hypothetical protein
MAFMNRDTLRLRALSRARGRGVLVSIGQESRTQQELVEEGHLWQEIDSRSKCYRFTLSPSGQRMLDKAEEPQRFPQESVERSDGQ